MATAKREVNDGIAESSLTPGTGTSCSQEMLYVKQGERMSRKSSHFTSTVQIAKIPQK